MQAGRHMDRRDVTNLMVPFPIVFLTTVKGCSQMAFSPFVTVETAPDQTSAEEARTWRVTP